MVTSGNQKTSLLKKILMPFILVIVLAVAGFGGILLDKYVLDTDSKNPLSSVVEELKEQLKDYEDERTYDVTTKYTLKQDSTLDINQLIKEQGSEGIKLTLKEDIQSGGIIAYSGDTGENSTIILDLNGHTYTPDQAVGSAGTVTQGFHFEKGWKVIIRNGTLKAGQPGVKMLVQNYADLTLENVILDGRDLEGTGRYVLSNNFGNVVIKGNTQILAKEGDIAFDLWYGMAATYDAGVSVTIDDRFTGIIDGNIEYGAANRASEGWEEKTILIIKAGTIKGEIVYTRATENANITISENVVFE